MGYLDGFILFIMQFNMGVGVNMNQISKKEAREILENHFELSGFNILEDSAL